jgi:uncharacterized integral membrane protein
MKNKKTVITITIIIMIVLTIITLLTNWTDSNLEYLFEKDIPNIYSFLLTIIGNGLILIFNIITSIIRI